MVKRNVKLGIYCASHVNRREWQSLRWNVNQSIYICCLRSPPNMSVSKFIVYLKCKSRLMLYKRFVDLDFEYSNRCFYYRNYYVYSVG